MSIILSGTALSTDLATIRNSATPIDVFRSAVHRIGLHLAVETSRHLPTKEITVTTPIEETNCNVIDGSVVIVPILRAGLGDRGGAMVRLVTWAAERTGRLER